MKTNSIQDRNVLVWTIILTFFALLTFFCVRYWRTMENRSLSFNSVAYHAIEVPFQQQLK